MKFDTETFMRIFHGTHNLVKIRKKILGTLHEDESTFRMLTLEQNILQQDNSAKEIHFLYFHGNIQQCCIADSYV